MKSLSRKLWNYIGGLNGFLLFLYCILIFSLFAFNIFDFEEKSLLVLMQYFLHIALIGLVCCPKILQFAKSSSVNSIFLHSKETTKRWMNSILFIVPFLMFFAKYIVYYPTAFSFDSVSQYTQVLTGQYDDWHPVMQTLFAIKLPLMLTNGWVGSISLFQIIVFSLTITYMLLSVKRYTNLRYSIITLLFIMLNPHITNMGLFPWKDMSFAIGALLLVTYALHIYFTSGEWLKKPINLIAFIVVLTMTTLFRHNAILFTIPFLIAMMFIADKKRLLVVCICFVTLIACVKGPLYTALGVEAPGNRQSEMLGLPMTIIGEVVANDPEKLDEETLEFAYKLAPKDVWADYQRGSYNSVKFNPRTNNDVIDEYGASKVLSMTMKCFLVSPIRALKALITLTEVSYTVRGELFYHTPFVEWNPYNIVSDGIPALQTINERVTIITLLCFPFLFMYIGPMHLILIIAVLAKCRLNNFNDWKKILLVLPVFVYNFGTTLLLTGAEDSYRFFYYTFLLVPVLLIILFKKINDGGVDEIVPSKL